MFEMACTKLSNFLEIVEEETVFFDGNKCHCLDFSESSDWCVYMKHFYSSQTFNPVTCVIV